MNHYEIQGTNLKKFQSDLAKRRQKVDTAPSNNQGTVSSRWKKIECGVPQG
jgi:hypothetical protein